MWSYGLNLRSIKLTVLKVVVSSEETCNIKYTACNFKAYKKYFNNCISLPTFGPPCIIRLCSNTASQSTDRPSTTVDLV